MIDGKVDDGPVIYQKYNGTLQNAQAMRSLTSGQQIPLLPAPPENEVADLYDVAEWTEAFDTPDMFVTMTIKE